MCLYMVVVLFLKELLLSSRSLLPLLLDEKFTSYLSAPYAGGSAGVPPSYGATEGDQPVRVVYVHAGSASGSFLSRTYSSEGLYITTRV